jgi:hypothetical protein
MATVKFYLNHPFVKGTKTLRKDEVSIDLVLTVTRTNRPRVPTGERVEPKYWDKKNKDVKSNCKSHIEINSRLTDLKKGALEIWRNNPTATKAELEAMLRKMVNGNQPEAEDQTQKKTSLFTVGRFIAQCARELDPKTVNRYRVLWRKLGEFQKGRRLDFSAFDMSFHDRFKNFLYDTPNPIYNGYRLVYDSANSLYILTPGTIGLPVGLFDDTVFKYITQLKTVCEWVAVRGYMAHASYKTWEVIKRQYKPITYTLTELEAIESLPRLGRIIKEIEHPSRKTTVVQIDLDYCRDYISFASRTGPRISDVKRFEPHQIKGDEWAFTQRKGNRTKVNTVQIPLTGFSSPAKLILEKYNYQLPRISETNLNIGIKEVCKRAGLTDQMFIERWAGSKKVRIYGEKWEFISSHTCKKSCITIMAGEGIPVPIISQITGTSERTIYSHYLGDIDIHKVRDYLNKAGENKAVMKIAN